MSSSSETSGSAAFWGVDALALRIYSSFDSERDEVDPPSAFGLLPPSVTPVDEAYCTGASPY